jgi:phosphoserine/homoserine phosphotransferase
MFCHRLIGGPDGRIVDYKMRQPDQKRHAVNALKGLNFQVMAAGDSYNDTGMLSAAHAGFFIHPPEAITKEFPQFPVTRSYAELKAAFAAASARLAAEAG